MSNLEVARARNISGKTLIQRGDEKMSYIREFMGSGEVQTSRIRRANAVAQAETQTESKGTIVHTRNGDSQKIHGYALVNGLNMYYEIEGTGDPLVYIPPAF